MEKRKDNSELLTTEILRYSLKRSLKVFWSNPCNRKIGGQIQPDLLDDIYIQDIDCFYVIGGREVSQFTLLLEAIYNNKKLPKLQGRFQLRKDTANGNATYTLNCSFELLGSDYNVECGGSIVIRNLLIQIL
jgi:hypothetical protein